MLRKKPEREEFLSRRQHAAAICVVMVCAFGLAGCKQEQAPGVYVEISLKNDADIDRYVVFNPNIKSVEECERTFAESLPSIMAHLPPAIPKNSTATGWKCSLKDPAKK